MVSFFLLPSAPYQFDTLTDIPCAGTGFLWSLTQEPHDVKRLHKILIVEDASCGTEG